MKVVLRREPDEKTGDVFHKWNWIEDLAQQQASLDGNSNETREVGGKCVNHGSGTEMWIVPQNLKAYWQEDVS